jgi:hypothetical protein
MEKQLTNKWKEHIRKMVEYSKKANKLKDELDEYLISKGFTSEIYETTMFEDSIIDCMIQQGDWEDLIDEIELEMNELRDEKFEIIAQERIRQNQKHNIQNIDEGLNGWLSPLGIFYQCSQFDFDNYYRTLLLLIKENKYGDLVEEDLLYDNGWINFISSKRNNEEYVFFKPMGNLNLRVTTEQVEFINQNFNDLTSEQQAMAKVIITDYI